MTANFIRDDDQNRALSWLRDNDSPNNLNYDVYKVL